MTNQESLRTSFDRLRSVAPKLNSATDDAAVIVEQVETFLNDYCSIGMPAEVCVVHQPDEAGYMADGSTWLSFARCSGKGYRISVSRMESGEITDPKPWSECSRDIKLLTFPKLPDLLREIEAEAGKALRATEEAASAAREIIEAMSDDQKLAIQMPEVHRDKVLRTLHRLLADYKKGDKKWSSLLSISTNTDAAIFKAIKLAPSQAEAAKLKFKILDAQNALDTLQSHVSK